MTTGNPTITYRMATPADIEALAELRWQMEIERRPETEGVSHDEYIATFGESLRSEMEAGRYQAWLAEADGQPVSCTVLIHWQMAPTLEELHRRRGYVSSVYTHPDYRRLGLARTLMEMLVAHARELGIGKLLLSASTMGRPLYVSMGFETNDHALELGLK